MYNLKDFLKRLDTAHIGYEKAGTGQYKGDFYVSAGQNTPHLHLSANGNFVGLKGKKGAITTMVKDGVFNIETIRGSINDLKVSHIANELSVKDALLQLAKQFKETETG